jgi:hypothetical protein
MAEQTPDRGKTTMTYQPTRTGDEASDRQARKEAIKARLEEMGVEIGKGPLVIDREKFAADNTVWTCESLQMMADQLDIAALLTNDPDLFVIYSDAASMFQQAHDAQCTSP